MSLYTKKDKNKKLVTKNYTFIFVDLVRMYVKNNLLRKDKKNKVTKNNKENDTGGDDVYEKKVCVYDKSIFKCMAYHSSLSLNKIFSSLMCEIII